MAKIKAESNILSKEEVIIYLNRLLETKKLLEMKLKSFEDKLDFEWKLNGSL